MNINKNDNYMPTYIIPPGVTLEETLESKHMSQAELAKRISRPEKTISEIINGITAITPETAIQLERALNVPASFWNNLEKNYQEQKARIEAKKKLADETELVKNFPYNEMVKYGWIENVKTLEEKVEKLLTFFGVDSLRLINTVMQVKYRKHQGKDIWDEAIAAWLRKGEIDASEIQTKPFDEKKLKSCLIELKQYSTEPINNFQSILKAKLAECGVALIFTPGLPKTYICGASRWLNPNKALIQLSIRGSFADIMWFTLYHEIAHILLHNKRERFVDIDGKNENEIEIEANKFSAENLISQTTLQEFLNNEPINRASILTLAQNLKIHPGIIVGRLQHNQIIGFNKLNELRDRYQWVSTSSN